MRDAAFDDKGCLGILITYDIGLIWITTKYWSCMHCKLSAKMTNSTVLSNFNIVRKNILVSYVLKSFFKFYISGGIFHLSIFSCQEREVYNEIIRKLR